MPNEGVFAVAGAKGGVGKTTTSINLGSAFAERGYSVAVVEADLAMANAVDFLDLGIDLESDPTLHDVLSGEVGVEHAIYAAPGGIDVLPSGVELEGFAATRIDRLLDVLPDLREKYDVVIIDTGAGLNREMLAPMRLADEVILVSTPRVASVRDVKKTKQLVDTVGGTVAGIVFSKSGTGSAPDPDHIAEFLSIDLLGHVPEDGAVPTAQDAGAPVVSHAPTSPATEAYLGIAERLDETSLSAIPTDELADELADGMFDESADGDAEWTDETFEEAPGTDAADSADDGETNAAADGSGHPRDGADAPVEPEDEAEREEDGDTDSADGVRSLGARVRDFVDRAVSGFAL